MTDSFVEVSMHALDCDSVCAPPSLVTGSQHAELHPIFMKHIARPLPPDIATPAAFRNTCHMHGRARKWDLFTLIQPAYIQACIHMKTRWAQINDHM